MTTRAPFLHPSTSLLAVRGAGQGASTEVAEGYTGAGWTLDSGS